MTQKINMTLIGCGKMGGAMLEKWLEADIVKNVDVVNPTSLSEKFKGAAFVHDPKVTHYESVSACLKETTVVPDVIVIGTKPGLSDNICKSLTGKIAKDTIIMSIMTGKSLAALGQYFDQHQPIIRTMPNTPAQVGKGVTVAVANASVTKKHAQMATDLLIANGAVHWTDDESHINVVAAISGSGPAYFDLFAEKLAEVGTEMGLSADLAMDLARKTLIGTGAMAESYPEKTLEDLRLQVTSPGGSTEKAVAAFEKANTLRDISRRAVRAAVNKNIALGKG